MAWYEAHQTLAKHPKTLKLASLINCERRYAVGLLHDLFTWGLDAAKKDGTLPGLNADEIASALDFSGRKGRAIVNALVVSGYLEIGENGYKIHDWYDYAGKFSEQREADKARKQEARNKKTLQEVHRNYAGNPPEFQRTESGNPPVTVPNLTVPNNYTPPPTRARAREEDPEPQPIGVAIDAYKRLFGRFPTEITIADMQDYLKSVEPEVIAHALELAVTEGVYKWSFVRGVLDRYIGASVNTLAAAEAYDQQFREQKARAKAGQAKRSEPANTVHTASSMDELSEVLKKMQGGG